MLAAALESTPIRLATILADTELSRHQSQRLFHGRGHCFDGFEALSVDYHPGVVLVTLFAELADNQLAALTASLRQVIDKSAFAQLTVIIQRRYLPSAPSEQLCGDLPKHPVARIGRLEFALTYMSKQNIGFFLDMAPGRSWLAKRSKQRRVLNLFSYTCALSVVASAAEAASVINMDMSKAALSVGRQNHLLNRLPAKQHGVQFLAHDIMKSFGKIDKLGPFDTIIVDPPSFQKGSFIADKHYGKILQRLKPNLAPGGDILLCLNAPEIAPQFIEDLVDEHWSELNFVGRLAAHADFPEVDRARGLKLMHYTCARSQ
ncbi:Ribosomal RNA large subunit methyltransferase I [Sinobacterium norvegicum]|uniref:Ribosomal RNA large subunit methyltransferase I n=1 Tax=Sinobacterium norvegicum TaxID=1641715 RepID=A0ABM9AHP2_9GAMM|nr:class I SAM-dependent methyltransferase [Sinobacterium norvegicum]CAH0992715.1 Ribosomal RNA large subunit methyltransferase I [Sinobacterium norvegicum]